MHLTLPVFVIALLHQVYENPIIQMFLVIPTFLFLKFLFKEQKASLVFLALAIPGLILPIGAILMLNWISIKFFLILIPAMWIFPLSTILATAFFCLVRWEHVRDRGYVSIANVVVSILLLTVYIFTSWEVYGLTHEPWS